MATYVPAEPGGFSPDRTDFVWCYEYTYVPAPNQLDCGVVYAYTASEYDYFYSTYCAPGYCFTSDDAGSLPRPTGFAGSTGGSSGGSSSGTTTVEFGPPFNLSVEDGILVGGAVVGVWLIGFAFRALRGALRDHDYPGGD